MQKVEGQVGGLREDPCEECWGQVGGRHSDAGCILEVKPPGYLGGLNVQCERKRGVKDDL